MEQLRKSIAIVDLGDAGLEPMAIRFTLEYFGFCVHYMPIGRPSDFLKVIDGTLLYDDTTTLVICGHGENGQFVMPELCESIYLPDEPRGLLGADKLRGRIKLDGIGIVATGCSLGHQKLAETFLDGNATFFFAAPDYVDGNTALNFVQRLFFRSLSTHCLIEAFAHIDSDEAGKFSLFHNNDP